MTRPIAGQDLLPSRTVDGKLYSFEIFSAEDSLRVLTRLTKIVGEPLTQAVTSIIKGAKEKKSFTQLSSDEPSDEPSDVKKRSLLDADVDFDGLGKAVGLLLSKMDEDDVLDLVKKLTSGPKVICDNNPVNFGLQYRNNLSHLFKVVAVALEVQYGNFIDGFIGRLPPEGQAVVNQAMGGIRSV
jgi:hypothetical protein